MNINIYYGGRGIIDDPTIYVLNRMTEVFQEIRVNVTRYNLYEYKNSISTLPQTLKEADGIILASTVEWFGIGGYMHEFLDACWLYGDKEKISKIYMCPVVMSTTYGEREAKLDLANAWEILGGLPCSGLCGYIENTVTLEMNEQYTQIIDKKAENMYRTIKQHMASFPASNQAVKQKIALTQSIDLTPQETEQLSQYVADDTYVQRQKEDIQELTSLFRDMMNSEPTVPDGAYIQELKGHFKPQAGFEAVYSLDIDGAQGKLMISVSGSRLEVVYGGTEHPNVEMHLDKACMDEIIGGRMSFQRAFMSGSIKMKGDFKALRTLDQIFVF